jgi:hypothetical protein
MHYFLGSHGTGKSTLCDEILKINPHFVVMEGLSRSLNLGFKQVGFTPNEKNKQIILNDLSLQLHNFTHKVGNGIATRSLIDQIIYNNVVSPDLNVKHLQHQWDRDRDYTGYIFVTPIEFPLQLDDARVGLWSDPKIQMKIEEDMEEFLLNQIDAGYISRQQVVYLTGSVKERIEKLQQYIKLT